MSMRITKHTYSNAPSVLSTIREMEERIYIVFESGPEMDIVTLNMIYEDRDGENWLSHFKIEDTDTEYTDRTTIAGDVLSYLNECINDNTKCFSDRFEITQGLFNIIDNIIEQAIKKHNIKEEN